MRQRESNEIIYSTALAVFADFGFRKATMDDIASRLNMTKGNLYLYARDKKDLYRRTVAHALLNWQARVAEAVSRETEPAGRFVVMCRKALEYLSTDDALRRVLVFDPEIFPMFADHDPYEEINRNSVAMIRDILSQGIAAGVFRPVDPDRTAEVIFMIYKMFVIRTYIRSQDAFMREMFDDTLSLLMRGLFVDAGDTIKTV